MKATQKQLEIAYFELASEYDGIYSAELLPKKGTLRLFVASQDIFDKLPNPYTTPKLPGVEIHLECGETGRSQIVPQRPQS